MSDLPDDPNSAGPRQRHVEMGVAAFMAVLGVVTIVGSLKVGIGWGGGGPEIRLLSVLDRAADRGRQRLQLRAGAMRHANSGLFAEWGTDHGRSSRSSCRWRSMSAAVPWLGIYVASALLTAGFMRWLGRYGWALTLRHQRGVQVVTYVTFEKWFLVPLPKGPLEDLLGL